MRAKVVFADIWKCRCNFKICLIVRSAPEAASLLPSACRRLQPPPSCSSMPCLYLVNFLLGGTFLPPVDPPVSHSQQSAHPLKPNNNRASLLDRQLDSMFVLVAAACSHPCIFLTAEVCLLTWTAAILGVEVRESLDWWVVSLFTLFPQDCEKRFKKYKHENGSHYLMKHNTLTLLNWFKKMWNRKYLAALSKGCKDKPDRQASIKSVLRVYW